MVESKNIHSGRRKFNLSNHNNPINSNESNTTDILRNVRVENPNRLIIGHLNINSTSNTFEILSSIISNNMDMLMMSGTKLDKSFPINQFLIQGLGNPIKFYRTCHSGGIREDILFRKLEL